MEIPGGFTRYEASTFAVTVGPLYLNDTGEVPRLALLAGPHHLNTMHNVHGGVLLSLVDTALGHYAKSLLPEGSLAVTVDLQATFMVGVSEGQWVEVTPSLDRLGRSMAFLAGMVRADGQIVAKANGSFFLHRRRNEGIDRDAKDN